MKKQYNKGFSLVELLIAVAVMTILISPIITQLFTTIKVSGQAKEKQYVVDSVNSVMEGFRTFDESKMSVDPSDPSGKKSSTDPTLGKVTEEWSGSVDCDLYTAGIDPSSGKLTISSLGTTITYNQTNYSLDSIGLGISKSRQTDKKNYTRLVVKNDLNNKLADAGYQIDYSIHSSGALSEAIGSSGFSWRSDNTVGVVDSSKESFTKLLVKASPTGGSQKDPNTVSVSNLQNIDASSMAIIQSDATTLDYEIEKALSATLVSYAIDPVNSETTLGQLADDPKGLNTKIKNLISNSFSTLKSRSIHVSITASHDPAGTGEYLSRPVLTDPATGAPKSYHVRCDVVYRIEFVSSSSEVIKPFSNYTSSVGYYSFNVLDRDYYTDKPTNILMIYEPLLLSTKSGSTEYTYYADNDYIDITTDEYTDGTNGEKSTMYLIGATDNWAAKTHTPTNSYVYDGVDYNIYRTYFSGSYEDVNVVVNGTPGGQPIEVYTNIGVGVDDTTRSYKIDAQNYYGHKLAKQFKIDVNSSTYPDKPPVYKSDMKTSIGTSSDYGSYDSSLVDDPDTSVSPFTHILPYYDENVINDGRLYQITVVYQNKENNEKTYITGAKGAN